MNEMLLLFSGPLAVPCLICLIAGIALLIIEMCIPGFGAPGIFGILCLIAAVLMQFIGNTVRGALAFTACVMVFMLVLVLIFLRSFRKGALSRSPIVNRSAVAQEQPTGETILPGAKGKALTPLRPAGIVEIAGKRVNAETDGTFLAAGTEVEVIEAKGLGIIVHEVL